ncbi:MAG: Crp/Fnr family transcriptional regulator [Pseudorhodoplanes sp.]
MSSLSLLDAIGYFNAALGVAMLAMHTMIPLRITGIAHNLVSIVFGFFNGIYPMLIQHSILLPVNTLRLFQMRRLIKEVQTASAGSHSMDWLKPFTQQRHLKAGETLFWKDDKADAMFFVVSGTLRLKELQIALQAGAVVGELGFISPNQTRTQTVECTEDAIVLTISYDKIEELYFQNPEFGFYFLRLAAARLFDNIGRLEQTVLDRDREIARLRKLLQTDPAA